MCQQYDSKAMKDRDVLPEMTSSNGDSSKYKLVPFWKLELVRKGQHLFQVNSEAM